MVWLVEFALFCLGIGLLATALGSKARAARQAEAIEQRSAAYAQTIRRTADPAELNAMSDEELRDVLDSAIRRFQAETANRTLLMLIIGVGAAITAIFLAAESGVQAFAVAAAIGGIVLYGLNMVLERRSESWIDKLGLDRDRLLIS